MIQQLKRKLIRPKIEALKQERQAILAMRDTWHPESFGYAKLNLAYEFWATKIAIWEGVLNEQPTN